MSGRIVSFIINLDTRWRWVVIFVHSLTYHFSPRESPCSPIE